MDRLLLNAAGVTGVVLVLGFTAARWIVRRGR